MAMHAVCLQLDCHDPLALCAAITPAQDLAALVPRMEAWIAAVCAGTFACTRVWAWVMD